jgi:hypothetical protein
MCFIEGRDEGGQLLELNESERVINGVTFAFIQFILLVGRYEPQGVFEAHGETAGLFWLKGQPSAKTVKNGALALVCRQVQLVMDAPQ